MKKVLKRIGIVLLIAIGVFMVYSTQYTIRRMVNSNTTDNQDNSVPHKFDGDWILRLNEMEFCEQTDSWTWGDAGVLTIVNGFTDWTLLEDIYTDVMIATVNNQIVFFIYNSKDGLYQAFFMSHCQETDTLRHYNYETIWNESWEPVGTEKVLTVYLTRA